MNLLKTELMVAARLVCFICSRVLKSSNRRHDSNISNRFIDSVALKMGLRVIPFENSDSTFSLEHLKMDLNMSSPIRALSSVSLIFLVFFVCSIS